MSNYRKATRDALVAALSDDTTGFNAQLASLGQTYGIQPFALEWGDGSKNVTYGYLDEEEVDVSQIIEFPGAVICTTFAEDKRRIVGKTFSGTVGAAVVLHLKYQQLDAPQYGTNQPDFSNDVDKYADAVADALSSALKDGRGLFAGTNVLPSKYREDRSPIRSTGDGHTQTITFSLEFEVHV
jgi:hypothetical protein